MLQKAVMNKASYQKAFWTIDAKMHRNYIRKKNLYACLLYSYDYNARMKYIAIQMKGHQFKIAINHKNKLWVCIWVVGIEASNSMKWHKCCPLLKSIRNTEMDFVVFDSNEIVFRIQSSKIFRRANVYKETNKQQSKRKTFHTHPTSTLKMSSEPQDTEESSNFLAFDKTNNDNDNGRGYRSNFQYRPYNRHQNYRNQNFRRNQHQQPFGGAQTDGDSHFAPANFSSPVHQQRSDNGFRHRSINQMNQFQHRRNFVPFNVSPSLFARQCKAFSIWKLHMSRLLSIKKFFIRDSVVEITVEMHIKNRPHQFNNTFTKVC